MNQVNVFDLKFGDRIRVKSSDSDPVIGKFICAGYIGQNNQIQIAILPDEIPNNYGNIQWFVFSGTYKDFQVSREPDKGFNPEYFGFTKLPPSDDNEHDGWGLALKNGNEVLLIHIRINDYSIWIDNTVDFHKTRINSIEIKSQDFAEKLFRALGIIE